MKRTMLVVLAVALITAVVSAQLVITSLNQNGELTWTNSVSNATYRVEWAGSSTGPWQRLDVLTNLSSISATSSAVTVKVPMFYRVVWLDAFTGTWNYSAFDNNNTLVVTGQLVLTVQGDHVLGIWNLNKLPDATNSVVGPQVGSGPLEGSASYGAIYLDLEPGISDYNVFLFGRLFGTVIRGTWSFESWSPTKKGLFIAEKESGARPELRILEGPPFRH